MQRPVLGWHAADVLLVAAMYLFQGIGGGENSAVQGRGSGTAQRRCNAREGAFSAAD